MLPSTKSTESYVQPTLLQYCSTPNLHSSQVKQERTMHPTPTCCPTLNLDPGTLEPISITTHTISCLPGHAWIHTPPSQWTHPWQIDNRRAQSGVTNGLQQLHLDHVISCLKLGSYNRTWVEFNDQRTDPGTKGYLESPQSLQTFCKSVWQMPQNRILIFTSSGWVALEHTSFHQQNFHDVSSDSAQNL